MKLRGRSVYSWLLLAAVFMPQLGIAQMSSFKHYGLDKSIFPSRIECIDQTDHGELLIGTLAGLVIYDGFDFKTKSVKSGLAESSISAVTALDERIYIGHWAGNISIYDSKADTFSLWLTAAAFEYASVRQIIPLSKDSVYAVTSDGRLFMVVNGLPERIALPISNEETHVRRVHLLKDREVVVSTSKIFQRKNGSDWEAIPIVGLGTLPNLEIHSAIPLKNGQWAVSFGGGVGLFSELPEGWTMEAIVRLQYPAKFLTEDAAGRIWISTDENGIYRHDPAQQLTEHFERKNGLSYNQIRALYTDKEGNVWIATTAGLDQYLGDAFTLIDQRSGLIGGLVWDVELANGKFYALTPKGIAIGSAFQGRDNPTVEKFIPIEVTEPKQAVFDGSEFIWILDRDGDLWKLSANSHAIVAFDQLGREVNCLEFVNGELWVGTDDGVFVLDEQQATKQITSETGLAGNKVTGIYYSSVRNETWITVLGAPTTLYYEGKFRQMGAAEGIGSSVIQDAAFDREGFVWFATYDKGVFRYVGDGKFESLSDVTELTSNTTFAIEVDDEGVVWVGHNWGVDAYDVNTGVQRWYGEDEGFMGVEVNAGAMRLGPEGQLWMGTLMGMLHFDPSLIATNEVEPSLEISTANLGPIDLLADHSRMNFLSSANDFSVAFSSVALKNPSRNKYFYRLRGAHENWKKLDRPGEIEYLSLPAGDFTFQLKACNDSDVCSVKPFELSFSIYPPFYQTWWFYTIVFLLVVMAIFFMDRYRIVNLLEEKHVVEEQLALKEQHMSDLQEDVQKLGKRLEEDASIIGVLEESANDRSIKTCEILTHFKLYQRKLEPVSSDGVLCFTIHGYHTVVLVDVGITGNAAHALRTVLEASMHKGLPERFDAESILDAWESAVRELESKFAKFKEVQWCLYTAHSDQAFAAAKGMAGFTFNKEGTSEWSGTEQPTESKTSKRLHEIDSRDAVLVVSDGLITQLNESGTKSYGKSRLLKLIDGHRDKNQEQLTTTIWHDVDEWSGAMEQFDDMTIYFWNHV